jgi:hypothetical protein
VKIHRKHPVLSFKTSYHSHPHLHLFWKRNENFVYFLHLASRHSCCLAGNRNYRTPEPNWNTWRTAGLTTTTI